MARQQLDELGWLGLDWDGEPVFQSERTARYVDTLSRLNGHIYECFCSRAEIAAASAPQGDEGPRYPGTCASLTRAQRAQRRRTRTPSIRLRVPEGPLSFHDAIFGEQAFDTQRLVGDFVLRRADGVFAYQLAVVVDDGAQRITEVLRADDLLPSTPRQLLLYQALGLPLPQFCHVPLVVGSDGLRLAKRHGDTSLRRFRQQGVSPSRLCGYLAFLCGLRPRGSLCTPQELLADFELDQVPRGPVVGSDQGLLD